MASKKTAPKDERDDITITNLYGGKVVVKFYENSHKYYVSTDSGKTFKQKTGVTSFIGIKDKSKALGSWQQQITADFLLELIGRGVKIDVDLALEAAVQNDVQRDKAADLGKEIHAWCEAYIRHQLKQKGYEKMPAMPESPEATTGASSFMDWNEAHKVKFISTETVVYSKKYDYVGQEDLTFIVDDMFCDADFKSSTGLYNGVRMQLSAYSKARVEMGGVKSEGRWAIRLSKYTEEEYYRREERKQEIKKAIARIQNKEYKEYPIKPFKIFEAVFLDNDRRAMNHDFDSFLSCVGLTKWDRATNGWGEGWSIDQADYSKLAE